MKIMVYDVAASNRGALSVLMDFYHQVVEYDKDNEWFFVISTPALEETKNIKVLRYPWIKRNPLLRLFFDNILIQKLIRQYEIDLIVSLQNVCISRCKLPQHISLHNALPFHKCDRTVLAGTLEILKQRYLNRKVIKSLKTAQSVYVPNEWIYNACAKIEGINKKNIVMIKPSLPVIKHESNQIIPDQYFSRFFYPANAEPYKRHDIIAEACEVLSKKGITDYDVLLTAQGDENKYISNIKEKCTELGMPIIFGGGIPREEVYLNYKNRVLLFPSEIETDALPIIEAMICNGYIIATATDFAECILKNYPNCVLIPRNDPVALAREMSKAIRGDLEIVDYSIDAMDSSGQRGELIKTILQRSGMRSDG